MDLTKEHFDKVVGLLATKMIYKSRFAFGNKRSDRRTDADD